MVRFASANHYHESFDEEKIVYNETSKELHAFIDRERLYINKTGFIILSPAANICWG